MVCLKLHPPLNSHPITLGLGLHELDPVFRQATLGNPAIKAVVRDLKFHHDPVGKHGLLAEVLSESVVKRRAIALQSMIICKQTHIGGEGKDSPCRIVLRLFTEVCCSSRTQRFVCNLLITGHPS